MTKAQANALMTAIEAQKINADAQMRFDAAGNETWNVALDTTATYTGTQISQLAAYCQQSGLQLTLIPKQMGVT